MNAAAANRTPSPPPRPRTLIPLIRHISRPVTLVLLRTPLTGNQATFLSLLFGLAAAYFFFPGGYGFGVLGGVLLFLNYVLDHCDGEIARAKGTTSPAGHAFDTFVDWVVHTALFATIGHGAMIDTREALWFWLGLTASTGSTINYALAIYWRRRNEGEGKAESELGQEIETFKTLLITAFREFARADFWLLVLVLALLDGMRYLLPFAAAGAQVYWVLQFLVRGRDRRV